MAVDVVGWVGVTRVASAVVVKAFGCDGGTIYIVEGAVLCVVWSKAIKRSH